MAIEKGYQANFNTLLRAAKNGDLALVECTDAKTGKKVVAICAIAAAPNRQVEISPLAKMFDGNPFEELIPPDNALKAAVDGGVVTQEGA